MKKSIAKKLLVLAVAICMALVSAFALTACGSPDEPTPGPNNPTPGPSDPAPGPSAKSDFTGVTFASDEVVYDGAEHELTVSGAPEGTKITYTGNKGTDAGEYNATAKLEKDGYNDKTLEAKLTIHKAQFPADLVLESKTYYYNRSAARKLEVAGTIPAGTEIAYTYNGATVESVTDEDEYAVVATLTNKNYETKTLNGTLVIKRFSLDDAKALFTAVFQKPDPWSYMPTAMQSEQMAHATDPSIDFTTEFKAVSTINTKFVGRQMHVLYEGLNTLDTVLGAASKVFGLSNSITTAYEQYVQTESPTDPSTFEKEVGGFGVKLVTDGNGGYLLAGNGTVSVELAYDKAAGTRTGRLQITNGAAIKYVETEDSLELGVKAEIEGVGNVKQIIFTRSEQGVVAGHFYEFVKAADTDIVKTSATIAVNNDYTIIVSDKRQKEDMSTNAFEEVYSTTTGEFISGRVLETISGLDYDTYWFNLKDVSGFNNVKTNPDHDGRNPDTVWINDQEENIGTTYFGLSAGLKAGSRRYDIEMRDVWYVVEKTATDEEEVKYELKKSRVPMLFLAVEYSDSFGKDFKNANGTLVDAEPTIAAASKTAADANFDTMVNAFNALKALGSYATVESFIGTPNEFFNKAD